VTILQSLFGARNARHRDALIDLLLMAAHADGEATSEDFDRIARAIETNAVLQGYDWDEVLTRAEAVRDDGPLFSDTRERVAKDLGDPELRRFGLTVAARCCRSPLAEEERALLRELADHFALKEQERDAILSPWTEVDPFQMGYHRCSYNDPDATQRPSWVDALSKAATDTELAILVFKAAAARIAMARLSETSELVSVGEVVDFGGGLGLRIDALVRAGERTWLGRFLAKGEALYPKEHELWVQILDRMDSSVSIFIGFEESLAPHDEAALRRIPPERILAERLSV
jgi:hypothetical protein